tara:strand:- start:1084 stop:2130 length:1047 start_codon:yes stop_codon:yes gene_type:complete
MKMPNPIYTVVALVALAQPAWAAVPAWEKEAPETVADLIAIQKQVQKVLPKAMAATVTLQMGGSSGSGVVVNKEGLVLTAGHVSGKPGRAVTVVLADGRRLKGKALGMHKGDDSGMVQIIDPPKDLPIVDFDKSKEELPKIGQWVISVGNPGGLDSDRGAVVRVGRVIATKFNTIRTDCMLLGGDSGGPLFDFNGVVVGIHSRISSAQDQNFHVSMPAFQKQWKALADPSSVPQPVKPAFLGVFTEDHEKGALVLEVREDSPASKGGLKENDIIQTIDGEDVKSATGLTDAIKALAPGKKIKVSILRDGKEKDLEVVLSDRDGNIPSPPKKEESEKPEKDQDEDNDDK